MRNEDYCLFNVLQVKYGNSSKCLLVSGPRIDSFEFTLQKKVFFLDILIETCMCIAEVFVNEMICLVRKIQRISYFEQSLPAVIDKSWILMNRLPIKDD